MGIIKKQSIIGTVLTYLGTLFGFITMGRLFPHLLSKDQIGVIALLVSYSLLYAQIGSLGFNSVIIRYFGYFRNKKNNHNGFLFFLFTITFSGFLLTIAVYFLTKPFFIDIKDVEKNIFDKYTIYILPLTLATMLFNSLDAFYRMLYNSVIGTFLKEFVQRVLIFIAIIIFFLFKLNFEEFVFMYFVALTIPTIMIIISLIKDKEFNLKPNFHIFKKINVKEIVTFSLFSLIASLGATFFADGSKIIVNFFKDLDNTGEFSIYLFFGVMISIPSRASLKISSAFITDAMKENNIEKIKRTNFKVSIAQFLIGSILFTLLFCNIQNIFSMLPEKYHLETGKFVIIIISLANLVIMLTGANQIILANSKYYKFETFFTIISILVLIGFSYIFIKPMGIVGMAISILLTTIFISICRYVIIYKYFRIITINNINFLKILIISIVLILLNTIIPQFQNIYFDIFIRTSVIVPIFYFFIKIFKINKIIGIKFKILGIEIF